LIYFNLLNMKITIKYSIKMLKFYLIFQMKVQTQVKKTLLKLISKKTIKFNKIKFIILLKIRIQIS
jgi:hypothetical protein